MNLSLRQIDTKHQWEEFVLQYCPNAFFQSWLWGEVQKKEGDDPKRLGIFNKNELVGLAQIVVIRARRGTFLHVRHGPIWKETPYWREFIQLVVPLAKKERAWFIRMSPLIPNTDDNTRMFASFGLRPSPVHEVDAERCWVLDIDKSEEELLLGMRKTTRYEIKRAQKLGVKVRKSENIDTFFRLYDKTSERHGFVKHKGIREEWSIFDSILYLASYENTPLASAVIVYYGGAVIYRHGASIPSKIPASYLLQWQAILEAKERGIKLYNFYGIAPDDKPNHPWRGITLFKKGFGGREVLYIHAHDYPISPLYLVSWIIETVQRKIRGY